MKKSSLLTLATAAAVIGTTAGTFAIWDTFDASSETTITVTDDVKTVSVDTELSLTAGTPVGTGDTATISYSGDVTFAIEGKTNNLKMELIPTVTSTDVANLQENVDYTVEVKEGSGESGLTNLTDETLTASNTYHVVVTVKNKRLAGKTLKVEMKAKASEKTSI